MTNPLDEWFLSFTTAKADEHGIPHEHVTQGPGAAETFAFDRLYLAKWAQAVYEEQRKPWESLLRRLHVDVFPQRITLNPGPPAAFTQPDTACTYTWFTHPTITRKATPMTDTTTPELNPMLELTSEQLARLAALVNAGELIRSGGLTRGNPGSIDDMIDLAEYVITGHTVVRTIDKKGRSFYMRVTGDGEQIVHLAAIRTDAADGYEFSADEKVAA